MCKVKLAVIDREGFYIDAVRTVLEQQPDMEVVACATIFEDFVKQALPAEIVVLQQEKTSSLTRQLIRELSDPLPDAQVIVLGAPDDAEVLISYFESGAIAYVRDNELFDQLPQMIRIVRAGETTFQPELAAPLVRRLAELGRLVETFIPLSSGEVELTGRQREVLALIATGMTNQDIAEQLSISVGTVKNHVHKIFERLHVTSREQAAVVYERRPDKSKAIEINGRLDTDSNGELDATDGKPVMAESPS